MFLAEVSALPLEGEEFMVGVLRIGGVWYSRQPDGQLVGHESWLAAAMAAIRGPDVACQDAIYTVDGETCHA